MAKQTEQTKLKQEITSIDFSFNIRYKKVDDDNAPEQFFQDNAFVNFRDDNSANRIVSEKPYLTEIIPVLVAKFVKEMDAANTGGADLKAKVLELLNA